jgi:hypothetical protein
MSEVLLFWSAPILPMLLLLAAPRLRWLLFLTPLSLVAVVVIGTIAPAGLGTGFMVFIALVGIFCGLALRLMGEFVWRLWSGR